MSGRSWCLVAAVLVSQHLFAGPRPAVVGAPGKAAGSSCFECHKALDEERLKQPAQLAAEDIHHTQGVTCAGCHGGDPTTDDPGIAMDPARGFVGKFAPAAIPAMCATCHGDATFMLKYAPNIPTDQYTQYLTSRHGLALAKGDTKVATCVSCHAAHGVLPTKDARSPVYPTRVTETCGRCHGDAALMKQYGIAGTEVNEYKRSVHFAALTEKNDLSAPTCNVCHGAHGATPPGVSSVSNVCGSCHITQRDLFDSSPHKDAFAAIEQPACESCHSNHAILPPQDGWIGVGEGQVCGACHSASDPGATAAAAISTSISGTVAAIDTAGTRVSRVEQAGMLMDDAKVKLEEAHQALVLARNQVHTVTPGKVNAQTAEALAATAAAENLAAEAAAEIRYRRTGLLISLAVIVLAIVAVVLKIRAMERPNR